MNFTRHHESSLLKVMAQQFFYATTHIEELITVEDNVLTYEEIKVYITVQYARDWWFGMVVSVHLK